MKRLFCVLLIMLVMVGPFAAVPMASAASDPIRVTDAYIKKVNDEWYYAAFVLSEDIGNARHFQTTERKYEPEKPEDSWDFPDALVDAGRSYIFYNDISVGEYIEALNNVWACGLFIEKNKDNGQQLLLMDIDGLIGLKLNEEFTIEIKEGMISREYKKFEPVKAVWDPKAQKFNVYRQNDGGLTLEQVKNGASVTTKGGDKPATKAPTQKATTARTKTGKQTTPKTGATSPSKATGSTDVTTTGNENSTQTTEAQTTPTGEDNEILPTLGSFDIVAKDEAIQIDFPNKAVKLTRSMTVKEFLGKLEAVSGYQLGVYNGSVPIEDGEDIYTGYKLKVRVSDKLIGSFLLDAPERANTGLIVLIVCLAAVVLLAGAGLLYWFVLRKKWTKRKG